MPKNQCTINLKRELPPPNPTPIVEETSPSRNKEE
jgi:hypothetical protein